MRILHIVGHAGENHDDKTSNLEHYLTEPYIALPLFIIGAIVIYLLLAPKHKTKILPIMLGYSLLAGVLTYDLVPIVSIVGLSVGTCLALAVSLGSIVGGK